MILCDHPILPDKPTGMLIKHQQMTGGGSYRNVHRSLELFILPKQACDIMLWQLLPSGDVEELLKCMQSGSEIVTHT